MRIPDEIAGEYPNGQPKNGTAAQHTGDPAQTLPVAAATGHRWTVNPARVVAWLCLWPSLQLSSFISGTAMPIRLSLRSATRDPPSATAPDLASISVAVLPFTNTGGDARSDYLSDGITESLIGNLSHIPQLKVRSRDAVFRLKAKDIDVQEAGNELGVSVVVSGRVTVQADNIEVSTELTERSRQYRNLGQAVLRKNLRAYSSAGANRRRHRGTVALHSHIRRKAACDPARHAEHGSLRLVFKRALRVEPEGPRQSGCCHLLFQ